MNLTNEKALQIAQTFIKYKYQDAKLETPYFEPHGSKGSKESVDCWVVPIIFSVFGSEVSHYLHIEDKTCKIMYVITPHGYNFINGVPNPEPEDDGEDWNDI